MSEKPKYTVPIPWRPFFFESNQLFDTIETPDMFDRIRDAYPDMSDKQIMACKEATYGGGRTQQTRDAHPNYGLRSEHDGDRTLGDFFEEHGMKIPPRATPDPFVLQIEGLMDAFVQDLETINEQVGRIKAKTNSSIDVDVNTDALAAIKEGLGGLLAGADVIVRDQSLRERDHRDEQAES